MSEVEVKTTIALAERPLDKRNKCKLVDRKLPIEAPRASSAPTRKAWRLPQYRLETTESPKPKSANMIDAMLVKKLALGEYHPLRYYL